MRCVPMFIAILAFGGLQLAYGEEKDKPVLPRWDFPKDSLHYRIENESSTKLGDGDKTIFVLNSTCTLDTKWTIMEVNKDGDIILAVAVERIRFSAKGEGDAKDVAMDYDSEVAPQPARHAKMGFDDLAKMLMSSPCSLTVNTRGHVTHKDTPTAWKKVFESNAGREMGGLLGADFSFEGFLALITSPMIEMPENNIAKNDKWTQPGDTYYLVRDIKRQEKKISLLADLIDESKNKIGSMEYDVTGGKLLRVSESQEKTVESLGFGGKIHSTRTISWFEPESKNKDNPPKDSGKK